MKQPSELTRDQLEDLLRQIRNILWQDPVSGAFDPDRSWTVETIEWVSGVLEDAGLKPDPVPSAAPTSGEPPAVPMRSALEALIRTIEATALGRRAAHRTSVPPTGPGRA